MKPATLTFAVQLAARLSAAEHDVLIYGWTSSAVVSASQASKVGKSVIVVSPDKQLRGLGSGGLGLTDTGDNPVLDEVSTDPNF